MDPLSKTMIMVEIAFSDIPSWLHNSVFFEALDRKDLESIPVPSMRATDLIDTITDLIDTLKVMEFWGARDFPYNVLMCCFSNSIGVWGQEVSMGVEKETFRLLKKYFSNPTNVELNDRNLIAQVARLGRLDALQILHERGYSWDSCAYCAAAQYGHLNVLMYLHDKGCEKSCLALTYAARGGHLECMQFLHSVKCEWDASVTQEFAVPCHYDYLEDLHFDCDNIIELFWTDDCHLQEDNGCSIHSNACTRAASYGLLDCLRLLNDTIARRETAAAAAAAAAAATTGTAVEETAELATEAVTEAAPYDPTDNTTESVTATTDTIEAAARYNHFDCMEYLKTSGCPVDANVAKYVASRGDLQQLEYLKANSFPWDESTTTAAALGGHLDCLRFAMGEGCPYNRHDLLQAAVWSGNVDCLKYLIEDEQLDMEDGAFLIETAFTTTDVACLQYLIDIDCPILNYKFNCPRLDEPVSDDEAFLKCLTIITDRNWQYNETLLHYIERPFISPLYTNPPLPSCLKYVQNQGWRGELKRNNVEHS